MRTWIRRPFFRSRRWSAAAYRSAGFPAAAPERQRASIAAAPASSSPTSIPAAAAGSRPTAESALKRPPTFAGTESARSPSAPAIARIAPFAGSVTSTQRSR